MKNHRINPTGEVERIEPIGEFADLSGEVEPLDADTKWKLLSLPSNLLFPGKYQSMWPLRSIEIPNTKPTRGLERLDPFH